VKRNYFYQKVLRTILLGFLFFGLELPGIGQEKKDAVTVFVVALKADIDPSSNRHIKLALEKAVEMKADYVIIEMDTYGGMVTDADEIRTAILEFEKPIYVYINKDAASAGALISIACDSIYMSPAASIGAATVVTQDGAAAPDKYQSYMRSIMRSTAEATGRDPKIAEAMVDQNLVVPGVSKEGEVVTFSTSEAIEHGYCEAEVTSVEEILKRIPIENYKIERYSVSLTEKIIALFLNPAVSGVLIMILIGGIYFELQTPGVGFPIAASVVAAILYFTPYYLTGLAENWEIIIFFIGIILIALEVFVIPGFGVAGILGILFTLSSLVLVMLNNDAFDFSFVGIGEVTVAMITAFLALAGGLALFFIGGVGFTNTKAFRRIALLETQQSAEGYTATFINESMIGKIGTSYTILHPSGKVMINGEIYDATTRGNYIDMGDDIKVIGQEGTSLKVKKA